MKLENAAASLEPLQLRHAIDLWPAAQDRDLWQSMPTRPEQGEEGMRDWIEWRIDPAHQASGHVWLVRDADGRACGSTSLYTVDLTHKRAEVGWTWYGSDWHGTLLNKACKRLILGFAFEELGLRRVQMKCDARNKQSMHAMTSIGATHEGTLRQHDEMWDGHIRDAEVFSIIDAEWPAIKARLDARLAEG